MTATRVLSLVTSAVVAVAATAVVGVHATSTPRVVQGTPTVSQAPPPRGLMTMEQLAELHRQIAEYRAAIAQLKVQPTQGEPK